MAIRKMTANDTPQNIFLPVVISSQRYWPSFVVSIAILHIACVENYLRGKFVNQLVISAPGNEPEALYDFVVKGGSDPSNCFTASTRERPRSMRVTSQVLMVASPPLR